jgi:hypothetical protein
MSAGLVSLSDHPLPEYHPVAAFDLHVTQFGHLLYCLVPVLKTAALHLSPATLKAGFAYQHPTAKQVLLEVQVVKAQWLILALDCLHVDTHDLMLYLVTNAGQRNGRAT